MVIHYKITNVFLKKIQLLTKFLKSINVNLIMNRFLFQILNKLIYVRTYKQ